MRTKSPKQIADQADRIFTAILTEGWKADEYEKKDKAIRKMEKVKKISCNYIDRIFIHANVNKWDSKGVNAIWEKPFKRDIYFTPLPCESMTF